MKEESLLKGKKNIVVLGNTENEEKYAYKIKHALIDNGFNVFSVPEDGEGIGDCPFNIDIIDFCINSRRGIELIRNYGVPSSSVLAVIQPGAGSAELEECLEERGISYENGCLLVEMGKL